MVCSRIPYVIGWSVKKQNRWLCVHVFVCARVFFYSVLIQRNVISNQLLWHAFYVECAVTASTTHLLCEWWKLVQIDFLLFLLFYSKYATAYVLDLFLFYTFNCDSNANIIVILFPLFSTFYFSFDATNIFGLTLCR